MDGISNHEVAVHVALGDQIDFQHGAGNYKHAAKFLLRHYSQEDVLVTSIPSKETLAQLKTVQPDTEVYLNVHKNQQLSTLTDQDAYSFILAEIEIAAQTTHEMIEKYHQAVALLPFEFEPVRNSS